MRGGSEVLIRQQLRVLNRALPAAEQGDLVSLHHARVASRRLREALPLVSRGARGHKLERVARRLTRTLGPVRELDVALQILTDLEGAADAPPAGIACLRRTIGDERARLHAEMLRRLGDCNLDKLRKRAIAAARRQDARPPRERTPRQLEAAALRMARRGERLRAAIENAANIYLPDRLHEVRIAVKKLRYTMEIERELRGSRATARIRTLKRVQDLLGRMHDLEVLIARTRALQGSPGAPPLKLSADLDRLVRLLETECRQLHVRYIAVQKPLLAICDHVTAPVRERSRRASAA